MLTVALAQCRLTSPRMGLCAATGEETDIAQGEELDELVREVGAESKYLMCATHALYSIAQHGPCCLATRPARS